jgi:3-methyladenine DNA glycosylase AlkD
MARPPGAFDARRYFRDTSGTASPKRPKGAKAGLLFHNVGTPRVRALAREIHALHRDSWPLADFVAFADILIADRHLEVKGVGIEVLARERRRVTPRLLATWKRWLARGDSANWATTDTICGMLVGPLLLAHPELAPRVAGWRRDRNMWVRRASVVGLLKLVGRGRALDLAYRVARDLHGDPEDLIQKAVGWMLREAGKSDPGRLERYLLKEGPRIPRTTVRYAIERVPPAKRRALLAATKSPCAAATP